MTTRKVLLCSLIISLLCAASWGIDLKEYIDRFQLTESQVDNLNEEAEEEYEKGVTFLDHVLFEFALQQYQKAAEAQPDNKDLKFLIGELAIYEGRKEKGEEAIAFFETARKVYDDLRQMEDLSEDDQEKVTQQTNKVNYLISSQAERDARRNRMMTRVIRTKVPVED
ncbi:MAG: hypothetical protein ACOC2L_04500 [Candidatus Sumerlaeota bacterium]